MDDEIKQGYMCLVGLRNARGASILDLPIGLLAQVGPRLLTDLFLVQLLYFCYVNMYKMSSCNQGSVLMCYVYNNM